MTTTKPHCRICRYRPVRFVVIDGEELIAPDEMCAECSETAAASSGDQWRMDAFINGFINTQKEQARMLRVMIRVLPSRIVVRELIGGRANTAEHLVAVAAKALSELAAYVEG